MADISRLLAAILLVNGVAAHAAASKSASATLSVTIRPAVAMTLQGAAAVDVKIRLAPAAQARIWKGDSCLAAPASGYTISQSGTYNIPLTAIEGDGNKVCLAASDGSLAAAVSLPSTGI